MIGNNGFVKYFILKSNVRAQNGSSYENTKLKISDEHQFWPKPSSPILVAMHGIFVQSNSFNK